MENINFMPRIGDNAPDFEATTTRGIIKFSEYNKNSWVVLFSHPADFTPVCTTELVEFAREEEKFNALNTKLMGLSIDSINSHIAWIDNVKRNFGVLMRFPMIADSDMKIAKLYGMLQPNESQTATVRAVYFIDPTGKIRLIMYYPMNVGRNMDEILRVVSALQTADTHKVSCPINWRRGDQVIAPAPRTLEDLEIREKDTTLDKTDFYLAKKSI